MPEMRVTESPVCSVDRSTFAEEYPFESRFLEIDGVRMHYVDEGSGHPLLMVHGNPTWSFAWRRLIRELSTEYRVIAVDHIGCGLSDKPQRYTYQLKQHIANLSRFVEQLDLSGVTLMAHDWGGPIGVGAAIHHRNRFSRFILFNTAAFRSTAIPLRIAVCRIPILGAFAIRGLNLFSRAALLMAVEKRERMTQPIRSGYLAPYNSWKNRIAVLRFVQDIPLRAGHPSYECLSGIEAGLSQLDTSRVLLIWGMQDWCFTPWFLREFQQRLPHAETFAIEHAGHYVFEDAHETVLPRVRQFLEDSPRELRD